MQVEKLVEIDLDTTVALSDATAHLRTLLRRYDNSTLSKALCGFRVPLRGNPTMFWTGSHCGRYVQRYSTESGQLSAQGPAEDCRDWLVNVFVCHLAATKTTMEELLENLDD